MGAKSSWRPHLRVKGNENVEELRRQLEKLNLGHDELEVRLKALKKRSAVVRSETKEPKQGQKDAA